MDRPERDQGWREGKANAKGDYEACGGREGVLPARDEGMEE